MTVLCSKNGCEERLSEHVNGVAFCRHHAITALREDLEKGMPELEFDETRKPLLGWWLRRLGRLAQYFAPPEGLTKSKIECRTYAFKIDGDVIEFTIDRHPAGLVVEQRWSFNIQTGGWQRLDETVVYSDFDRDSSGSFLCPECRWELEMSPGRARCTGCEFESLHEHSW